MTSLPVTLMTSVSVIIISVQVHLKNLYHVLYTEEGFQSYLEECRGSRIIHQGCYWCISYQVQELYFCILELLFLLLRICYLFFLGGGIFFKDNFLLHCSMFTSIKDDFKGILWSKTNYNVLGDVYFRTENHGNYSQIKPIWFSSKWLQLEDCNCKGYFLGIKISHRLGHL